ncbi:MAG: histidine kinase dimerization/phospho-acceptor domain-containing protein, partial [Bdellovibrionales bacterium]
MSGDTQRNAISEQLAHRLLPFVTIIALIITLIIPLGYISLEYNRTISEANNFARRLAFDIRTMALEAGDLWKYQATKYEQIFNSYVVGKDIKSIRVEDAEGNPVARQQDATAYRVGILEDLMIYGNKENIVLNNRKIGSIQVAISAHALIIKGILSFLVFVVLGAGLAVTVFRFPLKVVRRLEGKLFDYQVALEKMVEDRTIELKNAVDKARQLSDAAQTATKAKSQFLANMSHEIRTPMNGILGMAELLLMTELNEEQRSSVKTINDSGRMLLKLLN